MESNPAYLVITSASAQKDIAFAWEWYEERQTGLGEKFIDEINSKIQQIKLNPEVYSVKSGYQREASIKAFPLLNCLQN